MTTPPPARRAALRIVDIVVGLLLAVITGLIGIILLAFVQQFAGLTATCDGVAAEGVRCSPEFLNGMLVVAYAGIVFGWFLPVGLMIVRFVRRQLGFFLPIIAFVVMIAVFYLVSAALSAYVG